MQDGQQTIMRPVAGSDEQMEVMVEGTRVRHRRHPDLTGYIKALEWNRPGVLSPIPYNVAWDNNDTAYDRLGLMFIYASPETIEAVS